MARTNATFRFSIKIWTVGICWSEKDRKLQVHLGPWRLELWWWNRDPFRPCAQYAPRRMKDAGLMTGDCPADGHYLCILCRHLKDTRKYYRTKTEKEIAGSN